MTVKYLDAKRIQGVGFPASTGSTADLTMNGDPTVVTSPTPPTGLGTQSLHFDGTGDYYNGVVPINSVGQPYSFSFWFQSSVGNGTPIGFGSFSTSNALMLYYQGGVGAGSSQLRIGLHGGDIVTSSVTINVDTWYHCVVTYDGTSGGLKMYVNGSSNVNDNTGEASPTPNADTIYIGGIAGSQLWTGEVDDVGYWNKVLSTTEVDELYNSGTGKKANLVATDKLVAYYGCNSTTQTNEAISDKATLVTTEAQATAGWISVGSTVTISNGALRAVSLDTNSDDRMYKALGLTVSNTAWVCQFEANISTSNHTTLIGLTDGTGNLNAYDTILCDYNGSNIIMREYNGSTIGLNSTGIAVSTGVQYYITLTRTADDGLKLEVRTDSHSATPVGTETGTIGATTVDLDTVQSGAYGREAGSATYDIDNLKIYSGVTTATGTPVYETTFGASSDLPENTIFNETDTHLQYWLQDAVWEFSGIITRGCFGGGASPDSDVIDYITIDTLGTAENFGDLTVARQSLGGVSGTTRGVFGGGWSGAMSNVIDFITIATEGDADVFGELSVARQGGIGGVSSKTRGVFAGGYATAGDSNVMDFITIDTIGDAEDFGDLTAGARQGTAGVSSYTRGVIGGGGNGSLSNVMEYITIDTIGSTTDFGDLTVARATLAGVSSPTRGVFGGGSSYSVVMDYITISTESNAATFGDLSDGRTWLGGLASTSRGVFGGGHDGSAIDLTMDYITIDTLGDAKTFGDLTVARQSLVGVSA